MPVLDVDPIPPCVVVSDERPKLHRAITSPECASSCSRLARSIASCSLLPRRRTRSHDRGESSLENHRSLVSPKCRRIVRQPSPQSVSVVLHPRLGLSTSTRGHGIVIVCSEEHRVERAPGRGERERRRSSAGHLFRHRHSIMRAQPKRARVTEHSIRTCVLDRTKERRRWTQLPRATGVGSAGGGARDAPTLHPIGAAAGCHTARTSLRDAFVVLTARTPHFTPPLDCHRSTGVATVICTVRQ